MNIERIGGWYIQREVVPLGQMCVDNPNPLRSSRYCARCVGSDGVDSWLLQRARRNGTARVLALCDAHYTADIDDWLRWITARAELEGLTQ